MLTKEQVEKIRQHVDKATGFDIDNLTMRAELGALNFRESKADLDRLHKLLKRLSEYPIELLAHSTADSIVHILEKLHPLIDGIRDFSVEHESPQARNQLVAQLHTQTEAIVQIVAPWMLYLAFAQGDVQQDIQREVTNARAIVIAGREGVENEVANARAIVEAGRKDVGNEVANARAIIIAGREGVENEVANARAIVEAGRKDVGNEVANAHAIVIAGREGVENEIANIRATVEASRKDVDKGKQEIASIIEAARDAAAGAGVAIFTKDFTDKAAALEKTSRLWLTAAGAFVGMTISLAIVFAHGLLLPTEESLAPLLQVATTKLIVLGLLFSATIWCGRLYKATKHQAAVNEFRANGLKSFQAFVAATNDDATRNAVLLETTRAIFAHAQTGLIDAKAGDSEGSIRVVEVAKDAARKATPAADDTA